MPIVEAESQSDIEGVISDVLCSWHNTLVLTKEGQCYVTGDNKYGQLACALEDGQEFRANFRKVTIDSKRI